MARAYTNQTAVLIHPFINQPKDMAINIRKASRSAAKVRIAISGNSGSGKTWSALLIAKGLVGDLSKVCIIDTESGRADLYAEMGEYSVIELRDDFHPNRYVQSIDAAIKAGFELVIVDSATHEWDGPGGVKDLADNEARKGKAPFEKWAVPMEQHKAFTNKILTATVHIISTLRTKADYVMEEYTDKSGKKKQKPVKVGLANVQKEGYEYDQTIEFRLDQEHYAVALKDNTGLFADKAFIPTEETGEKIRAWLESAPAKPKDEITEDQKAEVKALLGLVDEETVKATKKWFNDKDRSPAETDKIIDSLKKKAAAKIAYATEAEALAPISNKS